MVNRSYMERGWMVGDGDVVDGSGVVEGRRVVHNRVVGLGVVHGVVGLGVVGVWDWVAVLVQPGLGGVRVLQGVGVQGVEGHGLAAVNLRGILLYQARGYNKQLFVCVYLDD